MKRNRRAGVEDRWHRTIRDEHGNTHTVTSASYGKGNRWRARYVDDQGREHAKGFSRKTDAQQWLNGQTAALVTGTHVAPRDAALTVSDWCALWLEGYAVNRPNTVRNARFHVALINTAFGDRPLTSIRPSEVKSWVARLQTDGTSASYVYALHSRLRQILADAVHDGVLGRNPCSRRTAPPMGKPKCYVASTEQIWALHDVMPEHLQAAILLGAFAGLRVSEACGLRVDDVDFSRGCGVPRPAVRWCSAQDRRKLGADPDSSRAGAAAGQLGAAPRPRSGWSPGPTGRGPAHRTPSRRPSGPPGAKFRRPAGEVMLP